MHEQPHGGRRHGNRFRRIALKPKADAGLLAEFVTRQPAARLLRQPGIGLTRSYRLENLWHQRGHRRTRLIVPLGKAHHDLELFTIVEILEAAFPHRGRSPAEMGLQIQKERGAERTAIELLIAGMSGWDAGIWRKSGERSQPSSPVSNRR
jgi:hypothetical protein